MYISDERLGEMKRAYRVLDVPLSATSVSIKQAYRKLIKRWHPDRYSSGTDEYAEATQMTKLINEGYSLIKDAPLRYHVDAFHPAYAAARQSTRTDAQSPQYPKVESVLKYTWFEFWVRLLAGAVFGVMAGCGASARHYVNDRQTVINMILSSILFAIVAVISGDKFWQWFLGRWWIWR